MLILLLACARDPEPTDTSSASTGDGGFPATPTEEGSIPAWRATGSARWTLDFDAEAEAQGYVDCEYARTWEGVQALDLDYLCPDCALIFPGEARLTEGLSCHQQLEPSSTELRGEAWGLSADGRFFRSGGNTRPLSELCAVDVESPDGAAIAWESEYSLNGGGGLVLRAEGQLSWWLDEQTLLPEPWPERTEPYACGWPLADPGGLELDYALAIGSVFPNVRLVDQCSEKLALWDLYGRWLVIDTAQPDCGPCRSMAASAEAFVEQMAAEGVEVLVVNLLGDGLAAPFDEPDAETYAAWVDSFQPSGPVLKDRGFGYALFPAFAEAATGESFGYPTWVVVGPDMRIRAVNVGFGTWDDIAAILRAG